MKFNNIESKSIGNLSVEDFSKTVHQLAEDLDEISQSHLVDPLLLSAIFYFGKDDSKALDWLENTVRSHSPNAPYMFVANPMKISLEGHPRLIELANEIGLPFAPSKEEFDTVSE